MKTGNWPKNEETGPIKEETDQKTEILKLFWKPETDPKNEGTAPKKDETDQQTENLKLYMKTGNWPKN